MDDRIHISVAGNTLLESVPGHAPVARKVDRLSCVRAGSAQYSVPTALIDATVEGIRESSRMLIVQACTGGVVADLGAVPPGEAAVLDEHYGRAAILPRRAVRPHTVTEKRLCALGPAAEAFITGATAAGHNRLGPELGELNTLVAAHAGAVFVAALEQAAAFGRWKAADLRSILAAGFGTTKPRPAGDALA